MATTGLMKQAWRGENGGEDAPWDFGPWTNPLLGAPLVYVTGVLLYMMNVAWGWPLVAGLLFTASFYSAARARGLRQLGVVFTVVLSVVTTAWLVYSTVVLTFNVLDWPATMHHLIAGAVIVVPLAVIWGLLVRDAGKARVAAYLANHGREAARNEWETITTAAGIKGWSTEHLNRNEDAVTVTMRIAAGGTTYRQAVSRTDALELACNAPFAGAVRIEQSKTGVAIVMIRLALHSTLAEVVPAPALPAAPRSILDPIVDSRFDDGEMSGRVHAYQSLITLGQRDSGKTGLQNTRVDAYAQCNDVLLLAIDFKEGRWLRPWLEPYATGQAKRPVFAGVGTSVTTVEMILNGLLAIGECRGRGTDGDKITPTPALPIIRLLIDEVADLLADPKYQHITDKLVKVVRKLRSEGIDVDLASQRGTMSFMGTKARDLLSQATIVDLLRVDSAAEVYNALSIPADKLGSVDPTTFEYPGTKLTLARGTRLAAARTILLEPTAIPTRAAHYARWRPVLEPDAIQAADKATGGAWSKLLAYDTNESRALLANAARHAGDTDNADRWTTNLDTTTQSATTTQTETISGTTSSGESMRDRLITQLGETEGEQAWQYAQGRMLLIAMRTIIGTRDYILTRDLLDQLASTDPNRWHKLDAKQLATLVGHHGVEPSKFRSEGNQRGYTRTVIEEAFNT